MKHFFILILCIFSSTVLLAQSFQSLFGVDSTQWNIQIGNLWGTSSNDHFVAGDTLINGTDYIIIEGYSISGFKGFLREDTALGKAWYLNNQTFTEHLIMDLQLNLGDSMFIGGNWNPQPGYYEVDSIYYFNNRKHLQFDYDLFFAPNEKFTLIEGISSNLGFRFQDEDYPNNFNPLLLCSFKDGNQEYGTGPCTLPGSGSSIREINSFIQIELYPNPTQQNITITIEGWQFDDVEYQIYTVVGKLVQDGRWNNSNSTTIDLNALETGLYLLTFHNKNKGITASQSFIKQKN